MAQTSVLAPRHDPLGSTQLSASLQSESLEVSDVYMQLVGSDGAGTHAVATLGGLIFDAAEERALPLSHASPYGCNGATFSHVDRTVKLVPGKSVRRMLGLAGTLCM